MAKKHNLITGKSRVRIPAGPPRLLAGSLQGRSWTEPGRPQAMRDATTSISTETPFGKAAA